MQIWRAGNPVQNLVRTYLLLLLMSLIATGLLMIRTGRDWGYGDWMINYEGGFVRRGLIGQICFYLGRLSHVDVLYFVAAFGILSYCALFYSVWRLIADVGWSWWTAALLISPATLAFPVVSRSSFRKEVLYFALLGLTVDWLRRHSADRTKDKTLTVCLGVLFPALVLSHEPLFAYLPYIVAAVAICLCETKRVVAIMAVPSLLAVAAMLLALTHIGDSSTVKSICESLNNPSTSGCSEAVKVLAQDRKDGLNKVALFISTFHYYRNYSIGIALALIPVIGGLRDLYHRPGARRDIVYIVAASFVAAVMSVDLFRYGVDWGRWINIHFVSLCLLLLLVDERSQSGADRTVKWEHTPRLGYVSGLLLILYALCWSVPGVKDRPLFGYASLAGRLAHWNGSLTNQ